MKLKIDDIGIYLKNRRLKGNLKLREVAEATQLSLGYISRLENGTSVPTENSLKKLCSLYEIDIKELADIEEMEDSSGLIDLNKIMLNENVVFKSKEISLSDKISILKFIDFITSVENVNAKKQCMNVISSLKELNDAYIKTE